MPATTPHRIRIRKGTRAEVAQAIRKLPRRLSGRERSVLSEVLKSYLILHIFTRIHKAFLAKSSGGKDELGNYWKPLKRTTIAARPIRRGEAKRLEIKGLGRTGRGLLSASQNKLWKGIFASNYARLSVMMGDKQAKGIAAKIAWAVLKSKGAKTKLQILGGRKVDILKVTGRLLDSLKPGRVSPSGGYLPRDEQFVEYSPQGVTLGSFVPYSKYVHKARRLWPTQKQMRPWILEASQEAVGSLARYMARNPESLLR